MIKISFHNDKLQAYSKIIFHPDISKRLERHVVRTIYERVNVAIEDLPKGVYIEWRDGFYVGVNYTNDPISLPIPPGSKILIGENPIFPAQAIVWK